jgi:hypothetical protein
MTKEDPAAGGRPVNRVKLNKRGRPTAWRPKNQPPVRQGTLEQRLMWRMQPIVEVAGPAACWPWPGWTQEFGYGIITSGGRSAAKLHRVHIVAFEIANGPVPAGLHVDHTCHGADLTCPGGPSCLHRRCVNPAHLEAVTQAENNRRMQARKTHCTEGHPLSGENLYIYPLDGSRQCRECSANDRVRAYYRKRKRELPPIIKYRRPRTSEMPRQRRSGAVPACDRAPAQ